MEVAGARIGSSAHLGISHSAIKKKNINTDMTIHGVTKVCSDRVAELSVQLFGTAFSKRSVQYLIP